MTSRAAKMSLSFPASFSVKWENIRWFSLLPSIPILFTIVKEASVGAVPEGTATIFVRPTLVPRDSWLFLLHHTVTHAALIVKFPQTLGRYPQKSRPLAISRH